MSGLQSFLRKNLNTILLLAVAGGFVMLLAELLLTGHYEGIQLVAVVATLLGLVGGAIALFVRSGWLRSLALVLFIITALIGGVGVLQHYVNSGGEAVPAQVQLTDAEGEADELVAMPLPEGGGIPEAPPPPLSPLALTGLALLGILVVLVGKEAEPVQVQTLATA